MQKSFPKRSNVLPEVKQIQKAQKLLSEHLKNIIPIHVEADRKTAKFDYRAFTDYILSRDGLLEIVDNPNTTEPVKVVVTFD